VCRLDLAACARVAVVLAIAAAAAPSEALAAEGKLRGIAIDRRLDANPLDADLSRSVPIIVRLSIDNTVFSGPVAESTIVRLKELLEIYRQRKVRVLVAIEAMPSNDADVEAWRLFIRAVAEQGNDAVVGYQIGLARAAAPPDVDRYAFLLKLAAVQLRSIAPEALVMEGLVPATEVEWQRRVFAGGVGPYVDGVALDGPRGEDDEAFRLAVQRMTALVDAEKPGGIVFLGPIELSSTTAAASRLLDAVLMSLGTSVHVTAFSGDPASLAAGMAAGSHVMDLVAADLVALDERTTDFRLLRAGTNATQTIRHRFLYNLATFDSYLVYWSAPNEPLDLEVTIANATTPMVRDPATGGSRPPDGFQREGASNRIRMTLPGADHPLIVDFNFGNSGSGTTVSVTDEAMPSVDEIVFRHQQAQAVQDGLLQTFIAHVRMEQHFHPSPADPAYNLVTENRLFSDRGVVEWEELSFELNGAKWSANRPAFPLVQPEKVLSLPLDLRLSRDYTYRLDGIDTINERQAFVVRFDPVDSGRALYRGTVWIDRRTFLRLKVQAVQTKSSGLVVSNDETQIYEPSGELLGRPIWLPTRVSNQQVFLIAGRTVLIEREVHLSNVVLNPTDFEQERGAARLSERIMYRDTAQGVRYLVKQGETRVLSDRLTESARAFALGADFDPSFDFPLPIGGFNILDFNFLDRNLQFALLFGGVIALGNVQRAGLWGGRFDASVDFFGLALKSNDDVFDANGRKTGERINRIPASTGVNLGYQATPFQKVTARYELHYDAYSADSTTAPGFVVPSSTATNGEGLGYEYRRRGYSLLANFTAYQRSTWTPWGDVNAFDPEDRTYTKYDVGLSKDFTFNTFHTIHLNGTYFGGERLDRFSMYQFGLFDAARMHGVPSAVRFADLGMFRGSYSFNLFEQYRFDLFVDHASGRDANVDVWQQVTGVGVRVNLRAPWNTLLQVDYGKSFLPQNYQGAGSNVLQILLLKPL